MISGLPGYSPEFERIVQMSKASKALGAALRGIGHVRDNTKAPGDTGSSQANQEGDSENRVARPELADPETGVEDSDLVARKRPRVTSAQTELFGTMLSDCEIVQEGRLLVARRTFVLMSRPPCLRRKEISLAS